MVSGSAALAAISRSSASRSSSGQPSTVIGVLEPGFVHPDPNVDATPDVFALLDQDEDVSGRGGRYVRAIARLNDGVSLQSADAELKGIAASLEKAYAKTNTGRSISMRPLAQDITGDVRTPLVVLQAATGAILLIVCVNLANLLLAAGSARSSELTVRRALGATRTRVMRQLLTESLVLAAVGGIGWPGHRLVGHVGTVESDGNLRAPSRPDSARRDRPAVCARIVCRRRSRLRGAPGRPGRPRRRPRGRRRSCASHRWSWRPSASSVTGDRRGRTLRGASDWRRTPDSQLLVPDARRSRLPNEPAAVVQNRRAVDPLSTIRNGRSSSIACTRRSARWRGCDRWAPSTSCRSRVGIPVTAFTSSARSSWQARNHARRSGPPALRTSRPWASSSSTAGCSRERDDATAPRVVVVNQALARQFFASENPIGRSLVYSSRKQNDAREIIGVVRDVRHFGLDRGASARVLHAASAAAGLRRHVRGHPVRWAIRRPSSRRFVVRSARSNPMYPFTRCARSRRWSISRWLTPASGRRFSVCSRRWRSYSPRSARTA